MKVCIVIKDVFVGEIDRPPIDSARGGFHIISRAKVCPACLDVWAIMQTENDRNVYGIESQFCAGCRTEYSLGVPGSLLDDRMSWTVDWDLIDYLPEVLLKREFELHVRMIEKDSQNERNSTSRDASNSPGAAIVASWSECPA